MSASITIKRYILTIASLLMLAACGGSDPYTVSPKSLTFNGIVSPLTTPPSQTVYVNFNESTYYGVLYTSGSYLGTVTYSLVGSTLEIYVPVVDPITAGGAGTYTGAQVIVIGCKDFSCSQPHSNSPQYVDVTYNVSPTFAFQEQQSIQEVPVYPGTKGFQFATPAQPESENIQNSQIAPVTDPDAVMELFGFSK
jgi:hypothetical protein